MIAGDSAIVKWFIKHSLLTVILAIIDNFQLDTFKTGRSRVALIRTIDLHN